MHVNVTEALSDLEGRKAAVDAHRPLPPPTFASLLQALRIEHTYASNAIEGNSLTLHETRVALEGITVGGKPLRDHLEAIDHADAFDYVQSLATQAEPVTEATVRSIHALVLRRSMPEEAGRYRKIQVFIGGSRHRPTSPAAVPGMMRDLIGWWRSVEGTPHHPAAIAAEFHARLVTIHPFADGNGRTTRLMANLLLMRKGYPAATWRPEDRPRYYQALEATRAEGNYDAITLLMAEAVARTFEMYEHAHRGQEESPPR